MFGFNKVEKVNIDHSFSVWLKQHQDPHNIFPPPLPAQQAVDFLMYYLLGDDYYVTDPISNEQCNTEIVNDILIKYSPKYNKERKLLE